MYQDRRTVFYGTLPDKIRSVLFYGTASQMPLVCGDIGKRKANAVCNT